MKKPMLYLLGDPWNGGKYESKKPLNFISYPEQRKAP